MADFEGQFRTPRFGHVTRFLDTRPGSPYHAEPMPAFVARIHPDGVTLDLLVLSMNDTDVDENGARLGKIERAVPPFSQLAIDRATGVSGTPARCYLEIGS